MSEQKRLATIHDFAPGSDKRIWHECWDRTYLEWGGKGRPAWGVFDNVFGYQSRAEGLLAQAISGLRDGTTWVLGEEEPSTAQEVPTHTLSRREEGERQ